MNQNTEQNIKQNPENKGQKAGTLPRPFTYSYSTEEQEEIRRIRARYRKETSREQKMRELRELDQKSTSAATAAGISVGIMGTLMMGGGMSIALKMTASFLALGIILGLLGIVVIILAYPVYRKVLERTKKKYADRILQLTDELLDEGGRDDSREKETD